jgi:hypothetical protein
VTAHDLLSHPACISVRRLQYKPGWMRQNWDKKSMKYLEKLKSCIKGERKKSLDEFNLLAISWLDRIETLKFLS